MRQRVKLSYSISSGHNINIFQFLFLSFLYYNPTMYKLSPSDFKYLWEDCKHCYYQKVKLGVLPHSGAFPAIFTYMNGLLQDSVMGKSLKDIHPNLPHGIIEIQEGYLKSKPIPGALNCYISGRFDILTRLDDGTYSVIDFKITNPSEEQIQKFSSQLHAYKFALENPADGKASVKVSKMGLVSVSPESIKHVDGKLVFTATPKWHSIEENMNGFYKLIREISTVLNGDLPPVSETCSLCIYRSNFSDKTLTTKDAIPF